MGVEQLGIRHNFVRSLNTQERLFDEDGDLLDGEESFGRLAAVRRGSFNFEHAACEKKEFDATFSRVWSVSAFEISGIRICPRLSADPPGRRGS